MSNDDFQLLSFSAMIFVIGIKDVFPHICDIACHL
jgi:hypothetical protein